LIGRLADLVEKHTDELAALEALNVGQYAIDLEPFLNGHSFT
jgi:hypothetical protein